MVTGRMIRIIRQRKKKNLAFIWITMSEFSYLCSALSRICGMSVHRFMSTMHGSGFRFPGRPLYMLGQCLLILLQRGGCVKKVIQPGASHFGLFPNSSALSLDQLVELPRFLVYGLGKGEYPPVEGGDLVGDFRQPFHGPGAAFHGLHLLHGRSGNLA